jgi:hypothetical protein
MSADVVIFRVSIHISRSFRLYSQPPRSTLRSHTCQQDVYKIRIYFSTRKLQQLHEC